MNFNEITETVCDYYLQLVRKLYHELLLEDSFKDQNSLTAFSVVVPNYKELELALDFVVEPNIYNSPYAQLGNSITKIGLIRLHKAVIAFEAYKKALRLE